MQEREKFQSRLGFILVSAGCAIGLQNLPWDEAADEVLRSHFQY